MIARRLPAEHIYDNGLYRFPAGVWESYFVNGKEYNYDGDRSLEEQKRLIAQDLALEGFQPEEIEEYISLIETKEGLPMVMNFEASLQWLKRHPEFKEQAMQILNEAKNKIASERESERNRRPGRR